MAKSRSTASSPDAPAAPPSTEPADPVTAYARDVVEGRVVACRLVRLAAERHLRDLEEGPARGLSWHPELANYYIAFFRYCRHSKGRAFAGRPIELEPWQKFAVGSVFGWLRANGTRRFRRAWEELPRKNGKSTKLAGIGLACLVADGELGADIYSAATKKDQARIIFDEARRMVRKSPALRRKIGIFKLNLSVETTASKFEPLSSDERTLDGLNPHVVLLDEVHKHKSRALLDVLDTALGARDQPLLWAITTAGDDGPESVYAQESDYAIKVLERVIDDDDLFVFITTIDKGDRWDDPAAWAKANPNLGVSVNIEELQRAARKAKNTPSALPAFKRLYLNVRTAAIDAYVPAELWARNGVAPFDPASLAGRSCYGGLDLSSKIDLSAFVKLFPPAPEDERWKIVARFWMPADSLEEKSDRDKVQYRRWVEEGFIEVTPGNVIDYTEIEDAIREDARTFRIEGIAFDPWNATQLTTNLAGEGLPLFEFRQGFRSYTAPTKELEAMLVAGKIDHGLNPVLAWMASNLAVERDKNDNRMPTKKHSKGRIDGMSALIMALARSMLANEAPYGDGRGLLII